MSSIQYFKEVATDWDNLADSFFGESPRQTIYKNVKWGKVKNVADLGCGSGYLTEGIISKDLQVTAVDQSQEMLDIMKSKFGDEKIEYRQGDANAFPLNDESMDLAMANMFLHHVDHPEQTIKDVYRILKPSGQWIFTDLDTHDNKFLITEQHDKWMGFDRMDIIKWMTNAGFVNVEIDCVGADCCAASCSRGVEAQISIFIAKGDKEQK